MARSKAKTKKKTGIVSVDFTGVEGGRKRVPAGDYQCAVHKVTEEESEKEGNPYLSWQFKVTDGKQEGAVLFYNTSLQPQALWNLKNVLDALGVEGTDSAMDLDLEELEGYTCTVSVEMGEYQGKERPEVVDISPAEDEEPEEKSSKKGKKSKDDDDEEDDKSSKKGKKSKDDDDEEDDKSSKKGKKDSKLSWDADAINDMDEGELEKVVKKADLEDKVDLDDYPTIRRKRAAVIDALDDAEMLDK